MVSCMLVTALCALSMCSLLLSGQAAYEVPVRSFELVGGVDHADLSLRSVATTSVTICNVVPLAGTVTTTFSSSGVTATSSAVSYGQCTTLTGVPANVTLSVVSTVSTGGSLSSNNSSSFCKTSGYNFLLITPASNATASVPGYDGYKNNPVACDTLASGKTRLYYSNTLIGQGSLNFYIGTASLGSIGFDGGGSVDVTMESGSSSATFKTSASTTVVSASIPSPTSSYINSESGGMFLIVGSGRSSSDSTYPYTILMYPPVISLAFGPALSAWALLLAFAYLSML